MPTSRQETFLDPRCPFCAEKVRLAAQICPHCHSNLAASPQFQAAAAHKANLTGAFLVVFFIVAAVVVFFVLTH